MSDAPTYAMLADMRDRALFAERKLTAVTEQRDRMAEALRLTNCSVLLDLAIRWNAQAEIHDAAGNADCGTGSDVPYAIASILRELAAEIEKLAYIFSRQNNPAQDNNNNQNETE